MHPVSSASGLATNRPLLALTVANGISAIGDWLYLTAIPVLVYRETEDPTLVGLAAAARLVPWLMLSIPAGAVADRVSGGHLLLGAESSRALLMVLMTALLLAGAPLWIVFGVALAAVVAGTFAMPTQGTLVPRLARNDGELGAANVISATFDNLACVLGPATAGVLIVAGGLEFAFALNGLSFLAVVVVLIAFVRQSGAERTGIDAPAAAVSVEPDEAERWVSIARVAAKPLAMDAAISFAAGAAFIVPVLIAAAQPGNGDALVGILSAGAGIGGVVGALAAGPFVNGRLRQGLIGGVAVAVGSFSLIATSVAPILAVAGLALVSGAIVQLDTLNMTDLQRSTHPGRLGRTLGLLHTLAAAWVMAGSIVIGAVAGLLGLGAAVLVCAVVVGVLGSVAIARPRSPGRSMSPSGALTTT